MLEDLNTFLKVCRLSQAELAEGIGVSRQTIHRWAAGKVHPSLDTCLKMRLLIYGGSMPRSVEEVREAWENFPSGEYFLSLLIQANLDVSANGEAYPTSGNFDGFAQESGEVGEEGPGLEERVTRLETKVRMLEGIASISRGVRK